MSTLFGVPWADAAIVAAAVGGAFGLSREALAFLFRLMEERRQIRRSRAAIFARVWHEYYQMGVGAQKAMVAWLSIRADVGRTLPMPAPVVWFLHQHDKRLVKDVLNVLDEAGETVALYLHATILRDHARSAAKEEEEEFQSVPYDYPRTRNTLRGLLVHTSEAMRELAVHLPAKPWWKVLSKRIGNRAACEQAAKTFKKVAEEWPSFSKEQALAEQARARGLLLRGKGDVGPAS